MPTFLVAVDSASCIGSAVCAAIAPRVFQMVGNRAVVIDPNGADEESLLDAANCCPTAAIEIRLTDQTPVYPRLG